MVYIIIILLVITIAGNIILWLHSRKTSQKVTFLLNAIDNGDYTFRFPTDGKGKDDKLVNASLNRIKAILQHARDEQIEHEKYYEVILDSVDTGIIVMNEERELVLRTNKAARQMLGRETITHISQVSDRLRSFSTRESYTMLKGERVKVIGFSDIHGELANQEIDAWVKLIRVLTHEIMNSLTPIIALSSQSDKPGQSAKPDQSVLSDKLHVIHSTSIELLDFVENYRKFTHVPTPKPELFYVKPFIDRMTDMSHNYLKAGCTITVNVEPKDLIVYADASLVSRVVSNILKNAAEAVSENGKITISAYTGEHDNVTIDISDDGPAIPPDIAAHIFVPFFTTKKQGSGIGLSISRQIMRTMGGMLELVKDSKLTTFRLIFQ